MENYIKHTQVSPTTINSRLIHPITGQKYPNRMAFVSLQKYAKDFFSEGAEPRMIGLAGLRGVGKTTLLWQVANYIYHNHTKNVYFFNVNTIRNLGGTLFSALEVFQKEVLQKRFNESTEPIALLFDEVHDDMDWANTLKILYDEARWCFILATGSSALLLNKTADLARRMHIEKIFPFKFTEYITAKTFAGKNAIFPAKGVMNDLKQTLFYSETSQEVYEKLQKLQKTIDEYWQKISIYSENKNTEWIREYISYHNIPGFLNFKDKNLINDSIIELFKRIIQEDIPKISQIYTNAINIEKILYRLAGSDEINIESLSTTYGIKKDEISEIVEILNKAELINVLFPYGGIDSKLNKSRKAFFMSPSLRRALLSVLFGGEIPENYRSKLFEDVIVLYLKRVIPNAVLSYSSESKEVNPDFIIETREKPILLESGLTKKSTRQIKMSKIEFRYGIIVSYNNKELSIKENTVFIPFHWFLLL